MFTTQRIIFIFNKKKKEKKVGFAAVIRKTNIVRKKDITAEVLATEHNDSLNFCDNKGI